MRQILIFAILCVLTSTGCDAGKEKKKSVAEIIKNRQSEGRAKVKPTGELALKLFETGSTDEAWETAQQVLMLDAKDSKAVYVAAKVLYKRGRIAEAIDLLDQIAPEVPTAGLMAAGQAGEWSLELGDLRSAENRFRAMKEKWPNEKMVDQKLGQILTLQNRRWEASKFFRSLIEQKQESDHQLMMMVDLSEPIEVKADVEKTLRLKPNDPLPKLGTAYYKLHVGDIEGALQEFEEVWAFGQTPTACWIGLGLAYVELDQLEKMPRWLAQRPPDAESFPEYWLVLGTWYTRQSEQGTAVRCLAESIALDDSRSESLHRLGALLSELGNQNDSHAVLERAKHMERLTRHLQRVSFGNKNVDVFVDMATELEWLGRINEANGWWRRAGKARQPSQAKSMELLASIVDRVRSQYELPDLSKIPSEVKPTLSTELLAGGDVQFQEMTELFERPIHFNSGDEISQPGMTIYQSNGAGVAVIDFDRDGWPDLYVLQGGKDPRLSAECSPGNLMRNLTGSRFEDVASSAGVTNHAYGQGAGVGDWNQDGFPELYVGNFGRNKLYMNNGDGTFSLVDLPGDASDLQWTASCAIADISGDGLPDLIDVNYADAEAALDRICTGANNVPHVCRPTEFALEMDRILINQGDGTFTLGVADVPFEDGRGLGLVVANFDRKHGNDVYIANDWSANTFLVSKPDPKQPGRFILRDEAGQRGCAVDAEGRPQASMGIACGDIDHDHQLDLFVTNFYDEYNTLYRQKGNGSFEVASRRYKLIESSMNILGFGTQFGDFNHDGWLDIVVVNGHVDDFRSEGTAYQMPAQVLIHRGTRFEWQPAKVSGPYFETPRVGRALATWDYNRDGQLDLVATHIDMPLAVLKNTSPAKGNWLELELIGTRNDRDAVGAYVEVIAGDNRWTAAVTAGDGYECSNEKILHFGLGQVQRIDHVTIQWPNGVTETVGPFDCGKRIQIIEGTDVAIR